MGVALSGFVFIPTKNAAAAFEAAGVGLCPGAWYGLPGYVRLNFGCPRATLEEALRRMQTVIDKLPA